MKRIFFIIILFIFSSPKVYSYPQIEEYKLNPEEEIQKYYKEPLIYVSLEDCINIALENNLDIKIAGADFMGVKWDYKNSLSSFLPNLSLSGYATSYQGQLLVGGALTDQIHEVAIYGGIKLEHDLTQGGKTVFEAIRKNKLKKASLQAYSISESKILYDVVITYYKLLEQKLIIESDIRDYYEREIQYKITQAQYEVGEGEKFDSLRAEIEMLQSKTNLESSINSYVLNQAHLCYIMNVSQMSPLMPVEREIKHYKLINDNETIESAYQKALKSRDNLKKIEYEIEALKTERRSVFSDFIPNANFNANITRQGTISSGVYPNTTAGINVTIPIGKNLGIGTRTKLKYYDEKIKAKEFQLEQEKLKIKESIYTAFFNSDMYLKRIELTKKQSEIAFQVQQTAQAKLLEGDGILLDLIKAQTDKTQKDIELSRAKINYDISQIDIMYHMGLLTREIILQNYSP